MSRLTTLALAMLLWPMAATAEPYDLQCSDGVRTVTLAVRDSWAQFLSPSVGVVSPDGHIIPATVTEYSTDRIAVEIDSPVATFPRKYPLLAVVIDRYTAAATFTDRDRTRVDAATGVKYWFRENPVTGRCDRLKQRF